MLSSPTPNPLMPTYTGPVHPEFEKALASGHLEPVLLPGDVPFVIDGVPFYQAVEHGAKLYQGRFMQFADIIDKHDRLKLDDVLLRGLLETGLHNLPAAIARVYSDPDGAVAYLTKLHVLLENARERLDLYGDLDALGVGTQAGRVFEVASVWYMSPSDDPGVWDQVAAKRYIALWLTHPPLYAFFLRSPIGRFVPFQRPSEADIEKSLIALLEAGRVDYLTYMSLLITYRLHGATDAMITSTESRAAMLAGYNSIYEHQLTTSMPSPPPSDGTN